MAKNLFFFKGGKFRQDELSDDDSDDMREHIWIRIKMIRIRNTVHSRAVCVLF